MNRRGTLLTLVLSFLLALGVLSGCGGTSGEKFASHLADQTSDKISTKLSRSPYAFKASSLILNAIHGLLTQQGSEDPVAVIALTAH